MSNIYIVQNVYKPNEATTNRLLGFVRAFDEMGVQASLCFLMPDAEKSTLSICYKNISVEHLWHRKSSSNRYLKYITGAICAYSLWRRLKSGDKVIMFDVCFWDIFRILKGVSYYYEVTENPDVISFPSMPFDRKLRRYYSYCRKLSGLFVISSSLRCHFEEKGINPLNIHQINMIVDQTRFDGLKKEKVEKYIAYCGTASNNKDGVDLLIKSFAIFHKTHPNIKLYIIGKTPNVGQAFSNAELVKNLGIEEDVVFTGILSAKKMPQVLKNATALALARPNNIQAKYGFPTKLGEYLSTENPVVITSVGDIPLYLEDGVSAFLADSSDISSFAQKLSFVFDNPSEAELVGKNGAKVAKERFSSDVEANKIINIIGYNVKD